MRQYQAPTRHRLSVAMAPCPPSTWTMMTVSSESWTQPYSTSCPRNTLTRDFAPHPPHQTPCKLLIVAWNVILTTVSKQHGLLVQKMSCDTFLRTVYKFLFKTLQTECIVFLSSDQEITGFPNCLWNQFSTVVYAFWPMHLTLCVSIYEQSWGFSSSPCALYTYLQLLLRTVLADRQVDLASWLMWCRAWMCLRVKLDTLQSRTLCRPTWVLKMASQCLCLHSILILMSGKLSLTFHLKNEVKRRSWYIFYNPLEFIVILY